MNTDFDKAVQFVLAMEGGYTIDLNDRGGETNYGISKRSYPNLDIKNLTREQAMDIYEKDFWQACKCDELSSPLSIAVFDSAVNQGVGAATRMLQIALDVNVDGIIGQKTITASYKTGVNGIRRFMAQRMARYIRTIMKDATQEVFAENWSNRLMELAILVFSANQKGEIS